MVILCMILAALNVSPFCDPLTQEEIETRQCHEFCDGVQAQINTHVAQCRNGTDNKCCNNDFSTNDANYFKHE